METILWQRDGKGCAGLEGLGDWLSSSHICLAVLFLFMLFAAFMRDEQGMGVEFTEGLKDRTCQEWCMWLCVPLLQGSMQLPLHHFTAWTRGREEGEKSWGAEVWPESCWHTLCLHSFCKHCWVGVSPGVAVTRAVPQLWALFALRALAWRGWLMELTVAEWSVSAFPFCYIHRLLCRTSKLSF